MSFVVNRLLVDLQDDVAATHANIFGERTALDILHNHAFTRRNVEPVRHLRSQLTHRDAELVLLGCALVVATLVIIQPGRKQFSAIGDRYRRVLLFSIAHEAEFYLRPGFARSYVRHQLISFADLLAVHGRDGVAHLQSRLIRWTAGHHVRNGYAGASAVNPRDRRILLRLKFNPDRTARYPMF